MEQSLTESILSLFIFQDVYVVSFLVAGIMVVILFLLMYNFKSPESVVLQEMNNSENIEGALRRVLGEQAWVGASPASEEGSADAIKKIGVLEQEVLIKDQEIADLHKQLTQGGSGGDGGSGNDAELNAKIDELEARLLEYEIIEDDIADLSLYKAENEKLKTELQSLRGGAAPEPTPTPEPVAEVEAPEVDPEPVIEEETASEEPVNEAVQAVDSFSEADDDSETSGRDLVAEFEKVVNNKDAIFGDEESVEINVDNSKEPDGEVIVFDEKKVAPENIDAPIEHPNLENVKPDSKEEADVFIADLKSLKKGS